MNNSQNTTTLFDFEFDNHYVNHWLDAIDKKTTTHMYCYIDKFNTLRFSDNPSDNLGKLFLHLYFDYADFAKIDIDIHKLVECLSVDEKIEYLNKYIMLLNEDAWLFYSLKQYMIKWVKSTYPNSFTAYIKTLINNRLANFKQSNVYKDSLDYLAEIADANAMTAKKDERDIVKELEIEHSELDAKIVKLNKFITGSDIFKTLSKTEQTAMKKQLTAMKSYAEALIIRRDALIERRNNNAKSNSNNE